MPVSISGTNGVVFPDNSLQTAAASPFGLKNRIINGDMVVSQRFGTSSISAYGYTLDRWAVDGSQATRFTTQQNAGSVTPPAGFTNYLGITSTAATSLGAGDYFVINQSIEGLNVADLGWGAAGAATVTISFWVRSSLTGTFGGALRNGSANRSYPFSYTISAANTWTKINITIPGDTSGTWLTNNLTAIILSFSIGTGSTFSGTAGAWAGSNFVSATGAVSVVGTNGATFYITGVQLERNTTATPFEWIPYGMELALCQRYYARIVDPTCRGVATGGTSGGASRLSVMFPVTMRAYPTLTTSGTFNFWNGISTTAGTTVAGVFGSTSLNMLDFDMNTTGSFPAGNAVCMYAIGSSPPSIMLSSEL
jgi:hypothetical protein